MEAKILTEKYKIDHNKFVKDSLLQKWEWGNFKKQNGWEPIRIGIFDKDKFIYSIQISIKKLPLGFSIIYSSFPYFKDEKIFKLIVKKIKKIAKEKKSIFLTIEPFENFNNKKVLVLKKNGFRESFDHFQPQNTLIINLIKNEEEILKEMKQKGRYNIRLAEKKGVEIREIKTEEGFNDYKKVHEETIKRDKISARPFSYLKKLYRFLKKNNLGTTYIAYYHNKPVASSMVSLVDERATYMYGASSNTYRNIMAPYLIQWEAIKDAKEKGLKVYDFYGIAPNDSKKHKWYGITRFKKQFGGNEIKFLGSFDLVFKPFLYNLLKIFQKIRKIVV